MDKKKSKRRFVFTLKCVNTELVENKYGISLISNINIQEIPKNTTKIVELAVKANPEVISFLDQSKRSHKCIISMIDYTTGDNVQNYDCFWCKYPFTTAPIGCPIKYVNNQVIKRYYSEISKDKYIIKENITSSKLKELEVSKDKRLTLENKGYYETDGIFCSFNCQIAFARDHKHDPLYNNTEILSVKMYNDMHETNIANIESAPHWRLLQKFGGSLTIHEFRNSFNRIEYEYHGLVKAIPDYYKPVGRLFEEKIKF